MSGNSSFGYSNIDANSESSLNESDQNEVLEESNNSNASNSPSDQSVNNEWKKRNEEKIAKLFATFGDSVNESLVGPPTNSASTRFSRWKNQEHTAALDITSKSLEESPDNVVYKRPRPFSRHASNKKNKKQTEEAVQALDLTDDSIEEKQSRVTRGFLKKYSTKQKKNVDVNAFDITDDSVVLENPVGFSKKYSTTQKKNVDVNAFDITDDSVVLDKSVEHKKQRLSRSSRKLTEDDINAFNITEDESSTAENQQQAEDHVDLVPSLDDDDVSHAEVDAPPDNKARDSLDEFEESGNEAEDVENSPVEMQSLVLEEAEGEGDSLNGEDIEPETKKSEDDVITSPNSDENSDAQESNIQKQKDTAMEGNSNQHSSFLLEYNLSSNNLSESRVVSENHDKSMSLRSSNNMTLDITLASRKSRRFSQHVKSQFLEVENIATTRNNKRKSRNSSQNLGKSFDDLGDVLNVSTKSLAPLEVDNQRKSPIREIPNSATPDVNRSFRNKSNENNADESLADVETSNHSGKRKSASRELFRNSEILHSVQSSSRYKSKESGKNANDSIGVLNDSLQPTDEAGEINRSLRSRSGTKDTSNKSIAKDRSLNQKSNGMDDSLNDSRASNRSLRNRSGSKGEKNNSVADDKSTEEKAKSDNDSPSIINDSQQALDDAEGNNRSLRNKSRGKREFNKSITEDQSSKQNANDSMNLVNDSLQSLTNAGSRTRRSIAAVKNSTPNTGEFSHNAISNENRSNADVSIHSSDASGTNNRSLRSRMQGKNVSQDVSSNSGKVSSDPGVSGNAVVESGADSVNSKNKTSKITSRSSASNSKVISSNEGSTGNRQKSSTQVSKETSVFYNSLDSFAEQDTSSFMLMQVPQNANKPSVMIYNNSMDSTVDATRQDQNFSSLPQTSDEMPAPKSLPARKRRLANVQGNTPSFSSVVQKKKKNVGGETDSIVALVEKENEIAVINDRAVVEMTKVDYKCPKLKKPEHWVTTRLYNWIIERLEPRYKLRSRLRAEEFVEMLCATVKSVVRKQENYEKEIEDLKIEMARLKLVDNTWNFFTFIRKFLPWRFQHKSLPLPQSFIQGKVVTYEKGTLFDPIL